MIRTQAYLPEVVYQKIEVVAKQKRKLKAQVIRDLLEAGLDTRVKTAGEALMRLVDLDLTLHSDPSLSSHVDK